MTNTDVRIKRLLDQLETAETDVEIAKIEKKIAVVRATEQKPE